MIKHVRQTVKYAGTADAILSKKGLCMTAQHKLQANRAICASTDEKASIFTISNKIPDFLSCYTMKSSNSTCMASKGSHICLNFLLCSSNVSFARGSNSISII